MSNCYLCGHPTEAHWDPVGPDGHRPCPETHAMAVDLSDLYALVENALKGLIHLGDYQAVIVREIALEYFPHLHRFQREQLLGDLQCRLANPDFRVTSLWAPVIARARHLHEVRCEEEDVDAPG